MSYLDRLLAMTRGDRAAPALAPAAPSAAHGYELEQHEVVEVGPPRAPTHESRAAIEQPSRQAPVAPRSETAAIASRSVGPAPATAAPPARPIHSPHSPIARDVLPDAAPPSVERPPPARPDPSPEAETPGLRTLREVMHWVSRPSDLQPPRVVRDPIEVPGVAQAASPRTIAAAPAPAFPAATPPAIVESSSGVEVTIGAIEVTIEPPVAPVPRPRPPARRATRDTRLERRLPRGG